MKLSAEQFAELAASFASNQSAGKHDLRRASRRALSARLQITVVLDGQPQPTVPVMVCDFSARGVGFLSPQQLPVGQQFIIELPRQHGGKVRLLCAVMNSRELPRGLFRMGAEFTGAAPEPAGSKSASAVADDAREVQRIRQSMMQ